MTKILDGAAGASVLVSELEETKSTNSADELINKGIKVYTSNTNINNIYTYLPSISSLLLNSTSQFSSPSFINDVLILKYSIYSETPVFTSVLSDTPTQKWVTNYTQLPIYFSTNTIKIPTKVEYTIRRIISRKLLKTIHRDPEVAKEFCLLLISQLTTTYFEILDGGSGWRALKAQYLRDLLGISPMAYKSVITALLQPHTGGQIIERDNVYIPEQKSYNYRLGASYIGKGIVSYIFQTKEANRLFERHQMRHYSDAIQNPICSNLIQVYKQMEFPSTEQILDRAHDLVDEGYTTKKGKQLTFLNKKSKSYYKTARQRSFIEEHLQLYKNLTGNGLIIPVPGSEASGGRVVDSITLMPSWIREMITIDGEGIAECDYSCLHPNIALSIYHGSQQYLAHTDIAEAFGIDPKDVKTQHLSFFNKEVRQMKKSPLFRYYQQTEPAMLDNIIKEKQRFGHRITSKRLFTKEVEIMYDVFDELNWDGIHAGYVYDAIICHPEHTDRVKEVMDQFAWVNGVCTTAKCTYHGL